ncbi:hypothetical protein ACFQY0_01055 [Haloferula chungangensis]|uniref:CopG family transcriptional regulator n=1 Tax=Haloferula chungangensis TaxID=1048331 RepID=A0ABW2L2N9_9BACT
MKLTIKPPRKRSEIAKEIEELVAKHGIPKRELERLLLETGLQQFKTDGVTIRKCTSIN